MKPFKLTLRGIEPFSINKAYYKKTFTRTRECRDWSDDVLAELQTPLNREIIRANKVNVHDAKSIHLKLIFFLPEDIFYTKKNEISSRKEDLTNIEKLLVDLLFNEKYGTINFNRDDKYLTTVISKERPSESGYQILVEVSEDNLEEM
jgi:hypothetical protein